MFLKKQTVKFGKKKITKIYNLFIFTKFYFI